MSGRRPLFRLAVALLFALSCERAAPEPTMHASPHPTRHPSPAHHVPLDDDRDRLRHPDRFLDFAGVRPGQVVLEIGGGDGYTAMHVAKRTGPTGSVVAVNPPVWHDFMQPHLDRRQAAGPLPGVEFVERRFDDPIPPGHPPLDLVLCVLIYHDILYLDVDRAQMNRRLYEALRPGGRFLVIDHAAQDTGSVAVGGTLHRIGRNVVIEELTAAGFELVAESDVFRMPTDPKTGLAWTRPQPRTDRFVLLFERS